VMIFSGRYAFASYDRLHASEAELRSLNDELRATREELDRGQKRISMITDNVPALIAYFDPDERYVFNNSYYKDVFGLSPDELQGKTLREAFGEKIYADLKDQIALALSGKSVSFEQLIHFNGIDRYFKYSYTPDFTADGKVAGFYSMVTDITDMQLIQDRLKRLARIDALTGLPNRNKLYERVDEALVRARRNRSLIGCLFLDLDHFKQINDTYGHAGGDTVLKQFGIRLLACVRQTDTVARLAGDEFVILLEGLHEAGEAERVAIKVIDAMKLPFDIEGQSRMVTASIGIVVANAELGNADELLKKADTALYETKRSGRNNFRMHGAALANS
jgi:diguanylate cyclase (GGDEF)-like protein/PAS domain S-box-containing protein